MEWIDYYNLMILFHLILQLLSGIFVMYKACRILTLKQISSKATPTMILYFTFMALIGLTLATYALFSIIFWRPDEILADQTTLYIIGFIPWILICLNPVIELCLCLERIFTISFPYQYLERSKRLMCAFTLFFFVFWLGLNIGINELINFPKFKRPICRFFTCFTTFMPKKYLMLFKIIISTAEGAAAILLLFLIKYKTVPSIYAKNRSRNTAMLIIISTTIIFEFTPNLMDQIFDWIFDDIYLVTYLGPYRTTISCISIIINILMYSKVFNKGSKESSTAQISPTITSPKFLTNNFFPERSNSLKF